MSEKKLIISQTTAARPAEKQPNKLLFRLNSFLLLVLIVALAGNQVVLGQTQKRLNIEQHWLAFMGYHSARAGASMSLSGEVSADAMKLVMGKGIPEIYGSELGVSFDQVEPALNVLKQFDPTYGNRKIVLTGEALQRYTSVGLRIACEYCCGAQSLVFANGQAACGCAHSQAMRGLLAYLITNHTAQYSDDELLREMARWKGLFFPKQMIAKLTGQLQGAAFTTDTAALVLGLKLPNYGGGDNQAPVPSAIQDLPSMVGGC